MTTRRWQRLAASSLLALALVGLGGATPQVGALEETTALKVGPEQSVEQAYPPILGSFPVPGLLPDHKLITPEDYKTAAYCAVVPLEVVPDPNLQEADEFFVTVELSWETETIKEGPMVTIPGEQPEPAYSETKLNDLDMSVWDDPMPAKDEGIEPEELAASDQLPEAARMYRPTKGKYQVVVVNYTGVNTGYKLKATYKAEKIESPFELLEPDFSAPLVPARSPSTPAKAPKDSDDAFVDEAPARSPSRSAAAAPSGESPAPPIISGDRAAALPSLSPVTIEPDQDFADFADSAFDEELAAPPGAGVDPAERFFAQRQAAAVGPVKDASAISLLFWLALVPLVLVGGGGAWLWRRSAGTMRLR